MRPAHIPSRWKLGHLRPSEVVSAWAFTAAVVSVFGLAAALAAAPAAFAWVPAWLRLACFGLAALGAACIAYGTLVEPWLVAVTRVELRSARVRRPVTIAHITDLHMRGRTRIEDQVLSAVRDMRPDLILVTGDIGNYPTVVEEVRAFVSELCAVAPVYCSRGNHEYRGGCPYEALQGLGPTWLLNARARVTLGAEPDATALELIGVDAGDEAALLAFSRAAKEAQAPYSVCLYHYPDFLPELGSLGFDLMLCGHTHGGQVVLPLLGPLVSMSRAGTRYAQGLFTARRASAYVSRGVGCMSYGVPRIRFLCPPEVACISILPEAASGPPAAASG